jgi:hypothetical protein
VFAGAIFKFIAKVLIVVLVVFGVFLAYRYFTTEGPPEELDYFREHVINLAAQGLTTAVSGTKENPRRILMAGDPKNRVRYVIKTYLEKSGKVEVLPPEFAEDAETSVKDWFFSAVRGFVKPEEAKVAQALAEQSKAEAILFTKIEEFNDTPEETSLEINFELQESKTGKVLNTGMVGGSLAKSIFSLTYLRLWMWSSSRWVRGLLWFLVTIFVPLVTYKLAWAVLAQQRNDYNAMLIAGYTIVDVLLAWILLGFSVSGFIAFSLFVMALLGSAAWNFLILDELEDMRH